MDGEPDHVHLL
ncbi:hypothetical protein EC890511_3465, partial [Escherichia coli 89.0511]